ncbi:MAG: carbohydrate-binding family 9-like protein [Acidobacteria bacterium]|nr:carbohydrate-binding family 9-like protein [Acidobacteriota bacterium]
MTRRILLAALVLPVALPALAADDPLQIARAKSDFAITADPNAAAWKKAKPTRASIDPMGKDQGLNAYDFRILWTPDYLYFHFTCPYDALTLKANPDTKNETYALWDWDVTEVFIGADFNAHHRYREYQVSPQGEWVDLDIDRKAMNGPSAVKWNSGFEVTAKIDEAKKIWYGAMKIPAASVLKGVPGAPEKNVAGLKFRMNVFRLAGKGPVNGVGPSRSIVWKKIGNPSHHTPEVFGEAVLVK